MADSSVRRLVLVVLVVFLLIRFNLYPIRSEHRTWYVDDDGAADFTMINDAVVAADPGDVIFVHTGTYNENVFVDRAVSLVGEDVSSTFVLALNSSRSVFTIVEDGVSITGFAIQGGETGVFLERTSLCSIGQNYIVGNSYGVGLHISTVNEIYENNIANNTKCGILLGESSDNKIHDNKIAENDLGVRLFTDSSGNILIGNNITYNSCGLALQVFSSNNNIEDNNVNNNEECGVWLSWTSNNTLSRNTVSNNNMGIRLSNSSTNIICENTVADNSLGVQLEGFSSENRLFHNNFIHNELSQVTDGEIDAVNFWDDGYPTGGNYWSNYDGTDVFRGPFQNVTGPDGIGDTPHTLGENAVDNYPLMGPFGPSTMFGLRIAVFLSRALGLVFENVTLEGSTIVTEIADGPDPPLGRPRLGNYYDIETTASYSGNITIRIIYDDTGLTEEEDLRLWQWNSTGARMKGDVTGPGGWQDGRVNILDIATIAKLFGVAFPDPNYDPRADLTGSTSGMPDGKINIMDISFVAINFGQTISQWENITTYIQIESNLICGETSHLSIFGVR